MSAKYWIKLYHEILHERKMAQLSDRIWRRAIECFLMAGEINGGGILPPVEDMAWTLRQTPEILETELNELAKIGLVEQRAGGWFVTNFAKRQAKMDKAEYMRRLREERQKEQYYQDEAEPLPDGYDLRYQSVTNGNADTDKIRIDVDTEGAPIGANGNRPNIFTETASRHLVEWWIKLVGGSLPSRPDDARAKYYDPADALLERVDHDVTEAKALLGAKRGEMIAEGKTPKYLEAVVFYIIADLDRPKIEKVADTWGSDVKVFD